MRAHVISDGVVVNTIMVDSLDVFPNLINGDVGGIGWLWDGVNMTSPPQDEPTPKTPEQLQAEIVNGAQQRLDDFARTRNYDGILSLCTYATDTFPKFAAEGQYGVQARSTTWAALYQILGEVAAGNRPIPSGYTDVEADLPDLIWPE